MCLHVVLRVYVLENVVCELTNALVISVNIWLLCMGDGIIQPLIFFATINGVMYEHIIMPAVVHRRKQVLHTTFSCFI